MTVELTNKDMGELYEIMEKYDSNKEFSDSISRVIQKKNTDKDLLIIDNNIDYKDIDFDDAVVIDSILGIAIGLVAYNF